MDRRRAAGGRPAGWGRGVGGKSVRNRSISMKRIFIQVNIGFDLTSGHKIGWSQILDLGNIRAGSNGQPNGPVWIVWRSPNLRSNHFCLTKSQIVWHSPTGKLDPLTFVSPNLRSRQRQIWVVATFVHPKVCCSGIATFVHLWSKSRI